MVTHLRWEEDIFRKGGGGWEAGDGRREIGGGGWEKRERWEERDGSR